MKRIMYLHGLESSNVCEKVDFLREHAEVLAPSIDYNNPNIEEELMDMVELFQPDWIIGSSMGGYVTLLLANHFNIKCIVFNPALHSRPMEPNLPSLSLDEITFGLNPLVVLGLEDDVIDPKVTVKLLEESEIDVTYEMYPFLGHRIPFDVFTNMYGIYIQ
jgi:esterase/lipase